MDLLRRVVQDAPSFQSFREIKPTLLVSWWCTVYAITIILFRAAGRYVRTEKVFIEDGIMLFAIVPLLMRMGFTHVVLLFGTNNVDITGLTQTDIHRRTFGSQMVLASRLMYAAYLWTVKYSFSVFLRTLTESVWRTSHQKYLRYLHIFLAVTFVGTIIGDLGACQPFTHYWQVVPAPAPQCRQGYAQVLTMGVLNIITNIALVAFPMPMIFLSRLPRMQKFSIVIRLSLPLLPLILTLYQLPFLLADPHHNSQPTRSLLASIDILLSTFVANAIVLGSLLQDRGYKKTKYKPSFAAQSLNLRSPSITKTGFGFGSVGSDSAAGSGGHASNKTKIIRNQWGSDEDLMYEDVQRGIRDGSGDGNSNVEAGKGIPLEEFDALTFPSKSRFPEIRVASTWDVQVDDIRDARAGRVGREGRVEVGR